MHNFPIPCQDGYWNVMAAAAAAQIHTSHLHTTSSVCAVAIDHSARPSMT